MPRPVAIRVSYRDDAAYMLRLEEAVSRDTRRTDAWRRKVLGLLHEVAMVFLQADADVMGDVKLEPVPVKKKRPSAPSVDGK